jgi:hypothetical protein
MKHNIIKTDNYLLVVDDSEIKEGDWYLRYNKFLMRCTEMKLSFNEALNKEETIVKSEGCGDPYERSKDYIKKIIAHLPLNNSPILEGVPLLPSLEDERLIYKGGKEIRKVDLSEKHKELLEDELNIIDFDYTYSEFMIFKKGYDKAKEKYKYTEEDIRFAIKSAFMQDVERVPYLHQLKDNIIKALQQPKYPVAFECDKEVITIGGFVDGIDEAITIGKKNAPKATTNLNGQTVWVGKYVF